MKNTLTTIFWLLSWQKNLSLLICSLILSLAAAPVFAQKKTNTDPFAPVGFFTGVESAAGTFDQMSGVCWGNTFVLISHGEWETHYLTVSVNYQVNQFTPVGGYSVVGGNWSLVVVRDNAYFGTIFGNITGGFVNIFGNNTSSSKESTTKQLRIDMNAKGGLGMFEGNHKMPSGFLSLVTDLSPLPAETNGFLTLAEF